VSAVWRDGARILRRAAVARQPVRPTRAEMVGRSRRMSAAALLAQTAALSIDELLDGRIDDLDPAVAEGLRRLSPDFDISTLADYPPAALAGLSNAVRGALFELEVADAVERGAIELPDGVAEFRIVDDFATPGFDALLLDDDGNVIELVQLKTSSTADIIERHLERYPDIPAVWTSTEAAADATRRGLDGVVDTGISDAVLAAVVNEAFRDQTTTTAKEVLDEIFPQVTAVVLAFILVWRIAQREPAREVIDDTWRRAKSVTVMSAVAGAVAMVTGSDALRIPTVLSMVVGREMYAGTKSTIERLRRRGTVVRGLRPRTSVHVHR
jgi:hypothetical protein